MDGDFRGDFTRDTFDRAKHFTRVLMQQGRVQLDADWNEQVDILLHYMRTLVTDLVGPYWGPGADDFEVVPDDDTIKFQVKKGHFYVDGILCESDRPDSSDLNEDIALKGAHIPGKPSQSRGPYVVYLDVWEREVTSIEDDGIREVALGGPDTTSRAKVMWKVRVRSDIPHKNQLPAADKKDALKEHVLERWSDWVKQWYTEARGSLDVRCNEDAAQETTPKLTSPASKYRGVENQLYRVEIHKGGKSSDGATFKWSRENGSAIFPIVGLAEKVVTVKHLERGGRFGLRPNDRVEDSR